MKDIKSRRLKLASLLGASFKYQQDILACPDKYRTVVKPRQAGMTTCFAIEALLDALTYDDYVICIVSPTARQSERLMRYIKKAFLKLEKELGYTIPTQRWTNSEIFFHHGSEIYSLPNNPKGIQGIDCNAGIVDEAGLFTVQEGEAIMDALVGSLGAKAKFPNSGKVTISGRPHGKQGLLWQYWDTHSPRYEEFTHFRITWEDRAREDKKYGKEVEKHKRILTKTQFDETYNALFVDEGILIFPHTLIEKAERLWETAGYVEYDPDGTPDDGSHYIGIDFGKKRSLTEIHVLKKESNGVLRTLMMKSLFNINFEKQKAYIDSLILRVRPVVVKIDELGMGLPLLDYFVSKHGSVIQPLKLIERLSKEKVILQLQNAFMDLKLAIPHKDDLYEQLHSFQKEYTDKGNVRYFGKVSETDFLDDKVIALAAAVDAAKSAQFGFAV